MEMMSNRRVVVSGIGAVTPFGPGAKCFWDNISRGMSAARLIQSFDVSDFPTRFAAQVPLDTAQLDDLVENQKSLKTMNRSAKMAVIAANEAVRDSKIDDCKINPYRFGTSLGAGGLGTWDTEHANQIIRLAVSGTDQSGGNPGYSGIWKNMLNDMHPLTPIKSLSNIATAHIAINHNARGNCQTLTTACTSGAQALGEAFRQIRFDLADIMIAGGSDSMVNPNGLVAFSMLGILSRRNHEFQTAIRPFDKTRDGFMIGEGAAIFVLEEYEHCKARGAKPYAEIIGYASTCDAFRITDEPPQAWGTVEAMKMALADARIDFTEIDYINAHGTGTVMNDKTETLAIKKVFKEYAYSLPVSSTKSMIGHLVASAGAVEFAACVYAIKNASIPPTINYHEPDPQCDLDYVSNNSRKKELRVVMTNSFGFGGQNASLILREMD